MSNLIQQLDDAARRGLYPAPDMIPKSLEYLAARKLEAVTAENAALKARPRGIGDSDIAALFAERDALKQRVEKLEEYGNHLGGCKVFKRPFKCSCGYDELVALPSPPASEEK